jgi:hypothetical protein
MTVGEPNQLVSPGRLRTNTGVCSVPGFDPLVHVGYKSNWSEFATKKKDKKRKLIKEVGRKGILLELL